MDDGKTHVVKYPYVGATCTMQLSEPALAEEEGEDEAKPKKGAKKGAKPAAKKGAKPAAKKGAKPPAKKGPAPPVKGANGKVSDGTLKGSIKNKPWPPAGKDLPWSGVQHCPDFNERRTLKDGKTTAVQWPAKGFNCHNEGPI